MGGGGWGCERWQREDIRGLKAVRDKPRASNKELPVQRGPVHQQWPANVDADPRGAEPGALGSRHEGLGPSLVANVRSFLLCAWLCSEPCPCAASFNPTTALRKWTLCHSPVRDRQSEAQRGQATGPRSHS